MPKFASQKLIFGAVVKIFRGEAESGLKILWQIFGRNFCLGVKISSEGGLGSEIWPMGAERSFKKMFETLFKIFWLPNWVFTLLRVRKY